MATGDIREIDMTKATDADGKKIRLVGDDGKGYWMEFSDLAAVVGGLLKLANENGTIGTYGELKDFNQCTKNGYYRVMGKSEDILNACPITYGIMDVRGENEPYKLQVVFDLTKKQIAYRMYGDSKWNEWYVY